jgi:hypothetical protein
MHHPDFIAALAREKQSRFRWDAGRSRALRLGASVRNRRPFVG